MAFPNIRLQCSSRVDVQCGSLSLKCQVKHKMSMFTSGCRVSGALLLFICAMGTGEDESNKAPDDSHFHAVPELFLLKAGSPEPHSLVPAADHPIAPKSKVSQTGRAGFGCLRPRPGFQLFHRSWKNRAFVLPSIMRPGFPQAGTMPSC